MDPMISCNILFYPNHKPVPVKKIEEIINHFGKSYSKTTSEIIQDSILLDTNGSVFIRCASKILSNFGMTRNGIFHTDLQGTLLKCWDLIGPDLIDIKKKIINSPFSRDRYILDINRQEQETLINRIWVMTKKILPLTMSASSYGLVGASKILFSDLPEIVLPVDNVQWKQLFKTVDLSDVLGFMVKDAQNWEQISQVQLETMDKSKRLTTIPSVYNAVAMEMRPKNQ